MNIQERRDRKLRQQKAEAATASENNAADWGRNYHHTFPNLMLVEVCREGSKRFEHNNNQIIAFVRGYLEARHYKRGLGSR